MLNITIFFVLFSTLLTLSAEESFEHSIIYAPWRDSTYTTVIKDFQTNASKEICPFCLQCNAHNDEHYKILARAKHHFILMNSFPYSKGHLLIIPYDHVAQLQDLSRDARSEMMELVVKAMHILQETLQPEGFNAGFNFGRIAGASVPYHLHIQIVPRYARNLSFLDIIGNTTLITYDIQHLYNQLLPLFSPLNS